MAVDLSNVQFSSLDYVVFASCLCISLGIGVYHAFTGNKTTDDFLMASRSMGPIPVAFSLTATYLSSISILGYIGEVYGHGLQLVWMMIGNFCGVLLATFTAIPLLYSLKLTSINEYIELRFRSRYLRKLASALNCISYITYLGLCLYAPTLALDAVTPLSLWIYIPLLGVIVTLYSSVGGLKAVVWTDTFQTVIIISGVLVATIAAILSVGGMENVWNIATEHGRTDMLDFRVGLHIRHTAINTMALGFTSFFTIYGFTQSTLQRVGTMPDMRKVRRVLYLNIFGLTMLISLLLLCGMGVFAVYAGCDPMSLGLVDKKDQLLPYFVMDHLRSLIGLPGLFVACLFCGTLSSISSVLNAVAAMIWVDFLSEIPFFKGLEESSKTLSNKIITFVLGAIMVGIAFAATAMGGVLQAAHSIYGAINGPLLGTFLLGMMVPQCTKIGAFAGTLSGVTLMVWLTIGSTFNGLKTVLLPLSTDECNSTEWALNSTYGSDSSLPVLVYNVTAINQKPNDPPDAPHPFYGISYTYFALTGALTCFIVGCLVTLVTGSSDLEDIDPRLVFKCFQKFVGKANKKKLAKEAEIEGEAVTKL